MNKDQGRSAIGGGDFNRDFDNSLNKLTDEVKNVLAKHDWSGMSPEQRSQITSSLYSTVQQSIGSTKEQLNERTGADVGAR